MPRLTLLQGMPGGRTAQTSLSPSSVTLYGHLRPVVHLPSNASNPGGSSAAGGTFGGTFQTVSHLTQ